MRARRPRAAALAVGMAVLLAVLLAACSPTFVRVEDNDDDGQPFVTTIAVLALILAITALIAAIVGRRRK